MHASKSSRYISIADYYTIRVRSRNTVLRTGRTVLSPAKSMTNSLIRTYAVQKINNARTLWSRVQPKGTSAEIYAGRLRLWKGLEEAMLEQRRRRHKCGSSHSPGNDEIQNIHGGPQTNRQSYVALLRQETNNDGSRDPADADRWRTK
jgi:hypothetical protein